MCICEDTGRITTNTSINTLNKIHMPYSAQQMLAMSDEEIHNLSEHEHATPKQNSQEILHLFKLVFLLEQQIVELKNRVEELEYML